MILRKTTIMTWESSEAKNASIELNDAREIFIQNMIEAGKTNGVSVHPTDTTTERYWTDLEAATEWSQWIQAISTRLSAGLISVTIEDL